MIITAGNPSSLIHVWLSLMVATTAGAVQTRQLLRVHAKRAQNIKNQFVWMEPIKRMTELATKKLL